MGPRTVATGSGAQGRPDWQGAVLVRALAVGIACVIAAAGLAAAALAAPGDVEIPMEAPAAVTDLPPERPNPTQGS